MRTARLLLVVDLAIFLLFIAVSATGYIQRWSEDWDVSDLHFYLSFPFVALVAVHIALHWRWIRNQVPHRRHGAR